MSSLIAHYLLMPLDESDEVLAFQEFLLRAMHHRNRTGKWPLVAPGPEAAKFRVQANYAAPLRNGDGRRVGVMAQGESDDVMAVRDAMPGMTQRGWLLLRGGAWVWSGAVTKLGD